MRTPIVLLVAVGFLCAGCTQLIGIEDVGVEDGPVDAHIDAETTPIDAPIDTPIDAPIDGPIDAPIDSPIDAPIDGPPPDCTTGLCCIDGNFAPDTTVCATDVGYRCDGQLCGGNGQQQQLQTHCSGSSSACNGAVTSGSWTTVADCANGSLCHLNGSNAPTCSPCEYGCEANACKQGTLWVFTTAGQFVGNMGGRQGVDASCATMYQNNYTDLECTDVHALIGISTADRITQMHVNYGIPTDVPVKRASDGVQVTQNWSNLVNSNLALQEALSPGAGALWTGLNLDFTCSGWTSSAASAFGDTGSAEVTNSWLTQAFHKCSEFYRLACVCWHDGN